MWSFARVSRRAREPWEGEDVELADDASADRTGADRDA